MKHAKLISAIAAAVMLCSFAACTGNKGGGDGTEQPYVTKNPQNTEQPDVTRSVQDTDGSQASSTPELPEYSYEYDEDKFAVQTVIFPENTRGRQDFNANIYDIEPFAVRFVLPKGWTYKDRPDKNELYLRAWNCGDTGIGNNVFSVLWVYDEQGNCVGALGYDLYEVQPGTSEEYYLETVYGFRGNHTYFDFDERLDKVENEWDNETAITVTCYDSSYLEPYIGESEAIVNPTILSFLRSKTVSIVFELGSEYADDALVNTIAESFEIVSD